MKNSNYIAIDWGTTHFRAYLLSSAGDKLKEFEDKKGCKSLKQEEFEPFLFELLQKWDLPVSIPIIACGMVGSLIGWYHMPYENIHIFSGFSCTKLAADQTNLNISIIHGLCQDQPHADVMRGEETQMAGFLASNPFYSGFLLMPGTHSKWALLKDGQIKSFYSFMTGELFSLLCQQSTLANLADDPFDFTINEFKDALQYMKTQSSYGLSSSLFHIRASSILEKEYMKSPYAFLSALLIKEEFLSMEKAYPHIKNIHMIGSKNISPFYDEMAKEFSYDCTCLDSEEMTIQGLQFIYHKEK